MSKLKIPIEIEHIYKFVEKGNILQQTKENYLIENISVISDFDKAFEMSWQQNFNEEDGLCWQDIKEFEVSNIWESIYKMDNSKYFTKLEQHIFDDLMLYLKNKIVEEYSELYEEIASDLTNCSLNILANDKRNVFFNKILEIYFKGYFPCGWDGEYPNGNIFVFSPSKEAKG